MPLKTLDRGAATDLPDNVVKTVEALGVLPVETDYDGLPQLNDAHTDILQNEDYVNHEGLMDMAHQDGLALIYTEPVQIPPEDVRRNAGEPVIFRAVVVTQRGVFCQYGDAIEKDTMVDAVIRMAETRAINRALRSAVNVGSATMEEMPDADIDIK